MRCCSAAPANDGCATRATTRRHSAHASSTNRSWALSPPLKDEDPSSAGESVIAVADSIAAAPAEASQHQHKHRHRRKHYRGDEAGEAESGESGEALRSPDETPLPLNDTKQQGGLPHPYVAGSDHTPTTLTRAPTSHGVRV